MPGIVSIILLLTTATVTLPASADAAETEQQPIAAEAVDRELVVRFSRAYGMARGAMDRRDDVDDDADLSHPEHLDDGLHDEIVQIMDLNGVSRDEWQGMLARMAQDPELRERIESLSTPFRFE